MDKASEEEAVHKIMESMPKRTEDAGGPENAAVKAAATMERAKQVTKERCDPECAQEIKKVRDEIGDLKQKMNEEIIEIIDKPD